MTNSDKKRSNEQVGINQNTTIIIITIMMAAMTQAGLVLYTPAFPEIALKLNISTGLVKTTLTAYFLGFGLSQLIYGPLSDKIGRKKPLLIGTAIFILACVWSALSTDYMSLLLSRILQGVGIGACMSLSRSILRDSFDGHAYVKAASYLSSGFAIGLGLTPVIGGHVLDYFSWQSEFIILSFIGALFFLSVLIYLPETNRPDQKLKLKNQSMIKETLNVFYDAVKNNAFLCYLVGGVMSYGVIIAYTTMTPFLFQTQLNCSSSFYGVLTLILAIFYYIGTWINRAYVNRIGINRMMKIGLVIIFLSGLFMLLANLSFGLFNLYVIFIPIIIATVGQAFIWSNCIASALKDLSSVAGTASAIFSCLQMLLSALLSGLIAIPKEHSQLPLSLVIIILSVLSFLVFKIGVFHQE